MNITRSVTGLHWAVQQRGESQRRLHHQTQRIRALHGLLWHEHRYSKSHSSYISPTAQVHILFIMFYSIFHLDHGVTVIQRRRDGYVNFDQTWEKYENGFGHFQGQRLTSNALTLIQPSTAFVFNDYKICHFITNVIKSMSAPPSLSASLTGEFWLGLRKIHSLVARGYSVLHIQLEDWKQSKHFIKYRFYLDGPESNYTIHLTHLSGDLPDPMGNHTGMMFSTKDRDNDNHRDVNCAHNYTGTAEVWSRCHANKGTNGGLSTVIGYTTCHLFQVDGGSTPAETPIWTGDISTWGQRGVQSVGEGFSGSPQGRLLTPSSSRRSRSTQGPHPPPLQLPPTQASFSDPAPIFSSEKEKNPASDSGLCRRSLDNASRGQPSLLKAWAERTLFPPSVKFLIDSSQSHMTLMFNPAECSQTESQHNELIPNAVTLCM